MGNTLIIRNHRIGDALIVLPLVVSLALKYKNETFTVITNERFDNLLDIMPGNVLFIPMVGKKSQGIFRGISYFIRRQLFLYRIQSCSKLFNKIAFLQYETFEKKLHKYILRKKNDVLIAITDETEFRSDKRLLNKCLDGLTMIGLHTDTLRKLGYTDICPVSDPSKIRDQDVSSICREIGIDLTKRLIAVAPFSKEKTKIYPLDKMEQVVGYFSSQTSLYQVLILGGGYEEKNLVDKWVEKYPSIISLVDRIPFGYETVIIAKCSLVLSMDSANLHLASLLHTPVVSIWGATTPENGYYPSKEDIGSAICKRLECQPCSIFGEKTCIRKNRYECLDIDSQIVIDKMEGVLTDNLSR